MSEYRTGVAYTLTGQIVKGLGGLESNIAHNLEENEFWLDGEIVNGLEHYVDIATLTIVERPKMPLAVSAFTAAVSEEIVISGVPVGTKFIHPSGEGVVDDGTAEWSTNLPGVYVLVLENFPYQEERIRVEILA